MWWDPWQGFGSSSFLPFGLIPPNGDDNLKNSIDSYRVYVNGDYVGNKELLTQGEEGSSAVHDYLQSRGFNDFGVRTDGGRIDVKSDEPQQTDDIKRHLAVYLSIR
ncbi:MAG: hypothetical protein PHP79_01005 [Clostridia bacterium]|nr:hypothetical protein [Clostridia bacterium]MDD4679458.1 hypothetical protein [Clostridia bacterium]